MRLIKIGEAAKLLGVSPTTIRNLCNQRKLAYIRVSGNPNGARRIVAESIDAYIKANIVGDGPEATEFPEPEFDDSETRLRERIKRLRKLKSA